MWWGWTTRRPFLLFCLFVLGWMMMDDWRIKSETYQWNRFSRRTWVLGIIEAFLLKEGAPSWWGMMFTLRMNMGSSSKIYCHWFPLHYAKRLGYKHDNVQLRFIFASRLVLPLFLMDFCDQALTSPQPKKWRWKISTMNENTQHPIKITHLQN